MNEKGLMAIAGITESELAWSNIYSHFMDAGNEPAYASAFINALLELCDLEYSDVFPNGNYRVRTEVSTTTQSENNSIPRIDILIESAKSIIIENKINHVLNNPLNKYWDYAINPAVLVVLTISRMSDQELNAYCNHWNKHRSDDGIKCINITHYDLITKAKELYGKNFENPILKELESIIRMKTIIMPDNLYIKNDSERIEANRIYDRESRRREMIVRECMAIKAFDDKSGEPLISFKSCPNNNWIHFRYRGQNDLVIGVVTAYLWDWERYVNDKQRRIEKNESQTPPVITLFVQVHGKLYQEMKRNNELKVEDTGYDNIPGKFCHIIDYDVDMTTVPEIFRRKGELGSFLTGILQDKGKCKILDKAEEIYKQSIATHIPSYSWEDALNYLKERQTNVGGEDFANWVISALRYILFDSKNQIVILEVPNGETKVRMEKFAYDDIMSALKYSFGDNVRCSILSR